MPGYRYFPRLRARVEHGGGYAERDQAPQRQAMA
jgi:hypothetical protein